MQAMAETQIFIDGDACPVKEEVYRVARRYGLHVHVVANTLIRVPREPLIHAVVVEAGPDAADDWIAGRRHHHARYSVGGSLPQGRRRCVGFHRQAFHHGVDWRGIGAARGDGAFAVDGRRPGRAEAVQPGRSLALSLRARRRDRESAAAMIQVTARLAIDDNELDERFVRASGPGGQNVNKVASKIELRVDLDRIGGLTEPARARLRALAHRRLDAEGRLLVVSQRTRDQHRNLEDTREKVRALVLRALVPPRPRRPTRVTASAKAGRLAGKRARSQTKKGRATVRGED
jgi:ribosome-associated protein